MTGAEWQAALEMIDHYANLWWSIHSGVWHNIIPRKRRTKAETLIGLVIEQGQKARVDTTLYRSLERILNEIEDGMQGLGEPRRTDSDLGNGILL